MGQARRYPASSGRLSLQIVLLLLAAVAAPLVGAGTHPAFARFTDELLRGTTSSLSRANELWRTDSSSISMGKLALQRTGANVPMVAHLLTLARSTDPVLRREAWALFTAITPSLHAAGVDLDGARMCCVHS